MDEISAEVEIPSNYTCMDYVKVRLGIDPENKDINLFERSINKNFVEVSALSDADIVGIKDKDVPRYSHVAYVEQDEEGTLSHKLGDADPQITTLEDLIADYAEFSDESGSQRYFVKLLKLRKRGSMYERAVRTLRNVTK